MKNIFEIFKRDIKNILTNWVALVVISGLIILPSLYAWFNIKASWDPYGNTNGIKVAIVNEDEGSTLGEKKVNVGEEVKGKLSENKDLGWQFVSREDGEKGVKSGKYYATIIFPSDFTTKTLSLVNKTLQKPELIYIVNEKSNAIAPKITDKGVSIIKSQIDSNIVETVNGIIFKTFNEAGISLENIKPRLLQLKDAIIGIDNKMPEIENVINQAYSGTEKTEEISKNINSNIPLLEETLNSTEEILKNAKSHLEKTKTGLEQISPTIKGDIVWINGELTSIQNILNDLKPIDKEAIINNLENLSLKATTAKEKIAGMIKVLEPLSKFNPQLKNLVAELNDLNSKLDGALTIISDLKVGIENSNTDVNKKIEELKEIVKRANGFTQKIVDNFDSVYVPYINEAIDKTTTVINSSMTLINNANNEIPNVKELIKNVNLVAEFGSKELAALKEDMPEIKKRVGNVVEKIKGLAEEEQINKIVELIKNDYEGESNFLASPVKIREEKLYPIPNYGSAMSPFYTILALWVGALILVSLLTVDVSPLKEGEELKTYEKYLGKYLIFVLIGICQTLIVTLGDLFLLKTYTLNPALLVGIGVLSSVIFTMIIYTLVSVLGNVGKAIGVVLLVLQVAASGGTFPIEVTSRFFQSINPFLPFTYAIGAMREAVAGVVPEVITKDIIVLLIYFVVALIIGLTLKGPINKNSKKFIEKLKESGLVGH